MDAATLAVVRAGRPRFRSRQDKLAYAIHAFLLAQGFKLVAAGPEAEDEASDFAAAREEVDAIGWDALEGAYAFRYQDTEGKRPPLYVKCLALGTKLLMHWASGSAEPGAPLELDVERYTTDAASTADSYQHLDELVSTLQQRMAGALARPGEASAAGKAAASAGQRAGPSGRRGPDEEDQGGRSPLQEGPTRVGGTGVGYEPPYYPLGGGVGAQDVVPPGVRPPGYGGGGGLIGIEEGPGLGGGGMEVGPGHPLFGPGRLGGGVGSIEPGRGPGRGDLPPGARWDPIAPPGLPGFRPGDFQHPRPPRPHPDVMQPGPDSTNFDAYFG